MFTPLRSHPERWLFTGLVILLLAPVIGQGLDRPLAHLAGGAPGGAPVTMMALIVAAATWLVAAAWGRASGAIAALLGGVLALTLTVARAAPMTTFLALAAVAAAAATLAHRLPAWLPPALDGLFARRRLLSGVYVAVALLSLIQTARVSVFMADPTRTDAQLVPGVEFLERHSCLTAYVRAQELARDGVDGLYRADRWPSTITDEAPPITPFSPFDIDEYFYPPPFLLVTEVLAPLRGDFLAQRAAWFGLNGLLLMLAFGAGARGLGGARWHRPLLLGPLLFASLPVLLIIQVGNVQALVMTAAVLAMLAFESRRPAAGGLGLALATLAKITPGLLGIALLAQRRWRAVVWTAGLAAAISLVAVVLYGVSPLASFVRDALPRLGSGEAFSPMLHHTESIAFNMAPAGVPFKFPILGVDVGDPWALARGINQGFTVVVVALAIVVGLGRRAAGAATITPRALAWMGLLCLAGLRSPFAPSYVLFSLLWAVTFLTTEVESPRGGVALVAFFALLVVIPPLPPDLLVLYGMLPQAVAIAVALWLILRRPPPTGG